MYVYVLYMHHILALHLLTLVGGLSHAGINLLIVKLLPFRFIQPVGL